MSTRYKLDLTKKERKEKKRKRNTQKGLQRLNLKSTRPAELAASTVPTSILPTP